MKAFLKSFLELATPVCLTMLAVDLLILFFRREWYDPIMAVQVIELAMLSVLAVMGIARAIQVVRSWE